MTGGLGNISWLKKKKDLNNLSKNQIHQKFLLFWRQFRFIQKLNNTNEVQIIINDTNEAKMVRTNTNEAFLAVTPSCKMNFTV